MLVDFGFVYDCLAPDDLVRSAAKQITAGKFVGWFQGGAEIGPRALGNRSILASPAVAETKDALNARVKFREQFRPFAPAVLAEYASEIFDLCTDSPYMLIVANVRPEWCHRIPAVIHVDGTARVQTVREAENSIFYALLRALHEISGVPVVLNTSFNLAGMPIVESPLDAVHCFLQTQLDELYLGNIRVKAAQPHRLKYRLKPGWTLNMNAMQDDGVVSICAPNTARFTLACRPCMAEAVILALQSDQMRSVAQRLQLNVQDQDGLDGLMKQLLRWGCVELHLGAHRFSNTRHDITWDRTLYESV
jgi:hypothetical protein